MIEATHRTYDSSRWGEKISFNEDDRRNLIAICEFSRGLLISFCNIRDADEFKAVNLLSITDRLLDRLKYAEKE